MAAKRLLIWFMIFVGSGAIAWGLAALFGADVEIAGKYTPEGRDFNTVLLSILIGVAAMFWGVGESGLLKRDSTNRNGIDGT